MKNMIGRAWRWLAGFFRVGRPSGLHPVVMVEPKTRKGQMAWTMPPLWGFWTKPGRKAPSQRGRTNPPRLSKLLRVVLNHNHVSGYQQGQPHPLQRALLAGSVNRRGVVPAAGGVREAVARALGRVWGRPAAGAVR